MKLNVLSIDAASESKTATGHFSPGSEADSPRSAGSAKPLAAIIAAFVIISLLYSFVVPLFESQDEDAHFKYLRHLAVHVKLPDYRNMDDINSADYESHQPPLYYFVQGMLLRISGNKDISIHFPRNPLQSPGNAARYLHVDPGERFPYSGKYLVAHLLRLTNIVAGALALLVIYKILKLLLPSQDSAPLLATAYVAFIPQFTYICGTMNNDAFVVLFAAGAIYFMLRFLTSPDKEIAPLLYLSVFLALAVLSKQLALFLVPISYLAVVSKGNLRIKSKNILILTAVLALLLGWFYLRNYLLFGDALNARIQERELIPALVQKKTFHQFYDYMANYFFERFLHSFWGAFGYMGIWMNPIIYIFYDILLGVGLVNCAVGMMDPGFGNQFSRRQKLFLVLLAMGLASLAVEILFYNLNYSQAHGRFAFSGLGIIAIFWGIGIARLTPAGAGGKTFTYSTIALLISINLFVLFGTVKKTFGELPERIDIFQIRSDAHLGELTKDFVVQQTFHCNISGLNQVGVKFTTFGRYNNNHIVFHLREKYGPPNDLVTVRIPASGLLDDGYHFFRFPPQENSNGRDYCFVLESPDAITSSAISCYATLRDSYPGGEAFLNGRPLPGDMTFITAGE